MDIYEKRFSQVFKKKDIHAVRGLFDEAYVLTNLLYAEKTFLIETEMGLIDIRPHILRASIATVAKEFSKKGYLNWRFSLALNKQKNCRHIELHQGDKILYIARVGGAERIPAKALYRKSIEQDLFNPTKDEEEDINVFLATYGDNGNSRFMFGKLGIHGIETWLYQKALEEGPYKAITVTTKHKKEELLVDLQDSIKEVFRKNENGDGT